jgi:hypothetical protein
VLVNPLSATPLFSPSSLARAACAVWPRGFHAAGSESRTSPNLPQGACYKAMHHSSLFSMDLSAMASPTLVIDPSDVARRVVESNLPCIYVCM